MNEVIKQNIILTSLITVITGLVLYLSYRNEPEQKKPSYKTYVKFTAGTFILIFLVLPK